MVLFTYTNILLLGTCQKALRHSIDRQSVYCTYIKWLRTKLQKKTIYKDTKFQNICLYETSKVAVSARAVGSDVRWRRILHKYLHVLRVTIHMRMQIFQPSIEPEVD